MKITFVNIRIDLYPPMGVCYLSSYLKERFEDAQTSLVELVMGEDKKYSIRKILETNPDVVGFTTYTVGFHEIQDFCTLLKEIAPDIPIWLGGPHITSLPHTLPISAEIGVIGEGEESVAELYNAYREEKCPSSERLSAIKGICFRNRTGDIQITAHRDYIENIDTIPPPDLSILNMKWYTAYKRLLTMKGNYRGFLVLSSRGCPFKCRFCQASAQWGKCRYHSAERVVAEIKNIRKEYPYLTAMNIIDDLFIGDRKRLREIVKLIIEKELHKGIVFNVNGHVNMINREVLDLLKSINVVQIAFGFESGSERVLDFLKKGSATVEKNCLAAQLTHEYGIGVGGQFMIGAPGETEAEILETISFIAATPMSHVHVSVTTPLPGTELWEMCKEQGLVSDQMDWRKLDFGNPRNPDLLYCNEATVPWSRFQEILAEVHRVTDKWNPPPAILGNLAYLQIYSPAEFARRALKKLIRIPLMIWRRLVS